MARSRKDRHQWKRKERTRTGKKDPAKVRLHRTRFLDFLKKQEALVLSHNQTGRYIPAVFHTRLRFDAEAQETEIIIGEQTITIPFLVEDPRDCHNDIMRIKADFDPHKEEVVLRQHADRMRFTGHVCHLEVLMDETRLCSSAIPCKYRRWNAEAGQAVCALPRDEGN